MCDDTIKHTIANRPVCKQFTNRCPFCTIKRQLKACRCGLDILEMCVCDSFCWIKPYYLLFRFRINCQFSFHSRSKLPTSLQGSSPSTSSSFNCMLLLNFENSLFDKQIHKYLKPTEKKTITRNFRKVGTKCVHKSKFMFGFVIISNLFVITIKSDRNMQFFFIVL